MYVCVLLSCVPKGGYRGRIDLVHGCLLEVGKGEVAHTNAPGVVGQSVGVDNEGEREPQLSI